MIIFLFVFSIHTQCEIDVFYAFRKRFFFKVYQNLVYGFMILENNEKRTRATQKVDILVFEIFLTKEVFFPLFDPCTEWKSGVW
jgi:hypothetical protein